MNWQKILQEEKKGEGTNCYTLPPLNLIELLPHLSVDFAGLWHSRRGDQTVLALLPVKIFNDSSCYGQMEELLQKDSRLTFLGGESFDGKAHHFVLTGLCLSCDGEKTTLTITWPSSPLAKANFRRELAKVLPLVLAPPEDKKKFIPPSINWQMPTSPPAKWREGFRKILAQIERGEVAKVVLGWRKEFSLSEDFSPSLLFAQLMAHSPQSYGYFFHKNPGEVFMSATPECLFEWDGKRINIEAIAGTRPRGITSEEDDIFGQELLTSPKERQEHGLVVDFLRDKLEQWGISSPPSHPVLLKLKDLQHLQTSFQGPLTSGKSVKEIIGHFHPTPAVAGWPTQWAKEIIKREENFERGLYAAPVGILQKDYAHFAVAIRSCLVQQKKLYLYAGAGIVADSREEEEWRETQSKFRPY